MPFTVTVIADTLHMRQGAGQTFDSLGFVKRDDKLSVQDIDATGTWLLVTQTGEPGKQGWCSARYLLPQTTRPAPWLAVAVKEIGVKEYPGKDIHPRIRDYLATVNNLSAIEKSSDETAWCSCFINWCTEEVGFNGTDSAWAKSWGNWRKATGIDKANAGDIAVFDRSSAAASGGHVAIYIDADASTGQVLVLGGNQSNAVRYSRYPMDGSRGETHYKLLSCRTL